MISLDQALLRSRNLFEGETERHLKALTSRLILDGVDPDEIDQVVAVWREDAARVIDARLVTLRQELIDFLNEGQAG